MLSSTSVISSGDFGEAATDPVSDEKLSAVGAIAAATNLANIGKKIQRSLFQRLLLPHYHLAADWTKEAADWVQHFSDARCRGSGPLKQN